MKETLWYCFVHLVLLGALASCLETDDPYNSTNARLITHLLGRYDKRVRPVLHPTEPITVNIYGSPYQIINVDQKRNLISISAHFEMGWRDAYLQWRPEEFDDAQFALLPENSVWTPDVFVYYSSDETTTVIANIFNVKVNSTGHVHSFVPFRTETICPIDVKRFPFDEQHCAILFGVWPPNGEGVHLHIVNGGKKLDVVDFYDSQEWTLENFSLLPDNGTFASGNTNLVVMHLHIARQWFYYVFNLVIPSALICILSVIGFHLPSASTGGRYTKSRLGMMTLLSMSVLLLSVVNELPKFAFESVPGKKGSFSSVPLIGIYYFSLLAIISLATVSSSWLVVLEKRAIREGVPSYLRWLMVEEWSCWGNRLKQRHTTSSKLGVGNEPRTTKVVGSSYPKYCLAGTSELAGMNEGTSSQNAGVKTQASRDVQRLDEKGHSNCGDEKLVEIYQGIHSLLFDAVATLRDMRAVLAEPLSKSVDAHAGLILKRLEFFCLVFYLLLVLIVLLMFFCWNGWYA